MQHTVSIRCWPAACLLVGILPFAGCGKGSSAALAVSPSGAAAMNGLATHASIENLAGQVVDPMPKHDMAAFVFIFSRCDCPISNRYAPEIRRLSEEFSGRKVLFRLIYPIADDTAAAIREHQADFKLPCEAFRDPQQAWVRECGVGITPEAVVFLGDRRTMVYRGRIDDRFVDFGVARAAPTTHDLEQAIEQALAGKSSGLVTTRAIGCFIGPLKDSDARRVTSLADSVAHAVAGRSSRSSLRVPRRCSQCGWHGLSDFR